MTDTATLDEFDADAHQAVIGLPTKEAYRPVDELAAGREFGVKSAARKVYVRRDRQWSRTSLLTTPTRRESRELERGFVAADRFDIDLLATPPKKSDHDFSVLEAVRPVDWLSAFRCDPAPKASGQSRPLTAQDHVVLEMLISAQRHLHPAMEHLLASVPVAAILHALGPGTRVLALIKSLQRLSTVECTLPGLRQHKARTTYRKARIIEMVRDLDDPGDDADEVHDLVKPTARRASVEPRVVVVRRLPVRQLRGAPEPPPEPERTRTGVEVLLQDHPAERDEDWWSPSPGKLRRFFPVVRWTIVDGMLHFELARWMRHWLNAFRKVDHRRMPYACIDLRQLAGFSSPYSPPLYRYLVAASFDLPTRTARVGDFDVRIPLRELAAIVGFRLSGAGVPAQMRTKVLARTDPDFASMQGRIGISPSRIEGDDVVWTMHVPLDVSRMRASTTWRQGDGRVVDIVVDKRKRRDDLAPLRIREAFRFRVTATEYVKVATRLRLDRPTIINLARVWQLAVDEALHASEPFWGDLTGNAAVRRYRGEGLLRSIEDHGPAGAFFFWASEEIASPDLTVPDVVDALQLTGIEGYASMDRSQRWLWGRYRRSGQPPFADRELPIATDLELMRSRRTERAETLKSWEISRQAIAAERHDLLAARTARRRGVAAPEPVGEYADPMGQGTWSTGRRFSKAPASDTRPPETPDPDELLSELDGDVHVVRNGMRDRFPLHKSRTVRSLGESGYATPRMRDLVEDLQYGSPDDRIELLVYRWLRNAAIEA